MTKERRLGRGLAALLGEPLSDVGAAEPADAAPAIYPLHAGVGANSPEAASSPPAEGSAPAADTDLLMLSVYEIDDNPYQPRREFSEAEIASLAESLKEHDMLQPILVRRVGDRFQLISGERRLRAAVQAGWARVPARVRVADDRLVAELAIVENLQRKDLNPIEKALSFDRYLREHGCTQDDLARRIKVDRSTIANLLRLLELPGEVQQAIGSGVLSAGHARALLPLGDDDLQVNFMRRVRDEGLSVRDIERQVQELIDAEEAERFTPPPTDGRSEPRRKVPRSQQVASLEQELRMVLGTKVEIRQSTRGRGKIIIHFTGTGEFERIRDFLTDGPNQGITRVG